MKNLLFNPILSIAVIKTKIYEMWDRPIVIPRTFLSELDNLTFSF